MGATPGPHVCSVLPTAIHHRASSGKGTVTVEPPVICSVPGRRGAALLGSPHVAHATAQGLDGLKDRAEHAREGMGRGYGGTINLTRGGSYDPANSGSGGSRNDEDVGIFSFHHNSWNTSNTDGFRCIFVPM